MKFRAAAVSCYPWIFILFQMFIIIVLLTKSQPPVRRCRLDGLDMSEKEELNSWLQYEPRVHEELSSKIGITVTSNRVFYNRVPKCGSSSLMELIHYLSYHNNFTFANSQIFMTFYMDSEFQANLAKKFVETSEPLLFERHLHFLQFTRYVTLQPVYINLIRDPLERLVSWYYFRRYQTGHMRTMPNNKRIRSYDACVLGNYSECIEPLGNEPEEGYFKIIPFFCGQEDYCRIPGERSLIQAIQNVKKYYAVVGITEQYSQFIESLEYVLPRFFKGASLLFKDFEDSLEMKYKTTYKLPVTQEVRNIMYPKLQEEYQFYAFIKNRFQKLSKTIKALKEKFHPKRNSNTSS